MTDETTPQTTECPSKQPSPHMGLSITVVVVYGLMAIVFRNVISLVFLLAACGTLYYSLRTKEMIKRSDDEKARKYSKYAKRSAIALLIFFFLILGIICLGIFAVSTAAYK